MRSRDAAISNFYAAATRDCACGCGHCHDRFDGKKVFDAALRSLGELGMRTTVNVNFRDAGWDESKHKRENGRFTSAQHVSAAEAHEHAAKLHTHAVVNHISVTPKQRSDASSKARKLTKASGHQKARKASDWSAGKHGFIAHSAHMAAAKEHRKAAAQNS